MSDQIPPPLIHREAAWATYLKAAGTIFPALFIWLFSKSYMMPKLEWLWEHTNLNNSKAQWLMDASRFFAHGMESVFGAIALSFFVLELWVPAWPRYRRASVSIVTVAFHTAVLLALASIATAVLLAAPILTRTK